MTTKFNALELQPMLQRSTRFRWGHVSLPLLALVALMMVCPCHCVDPSIAIDQTSSEVLVQVRTQSPIIGVHSHQDQTSGDEFIAASYINCIESAGGRAADLIRLVASVNGILFPGGDPEPSPTAAFLYARALDLNRNGTYISLWGACLAFEWLVQLHTGDLRILDNTQKLSLTLNL
ncbi:hypothetical protein H257_06134 [Aphanomyces astaci]|uniref:Folate gamma-glutamyl hydrolase n=1 Tax=Aphanomyces astaci TaxID=112090 RepID=W4GLQ5_APHAT|nr:hypothetical protein H257_06134 [Aphanomyces astaci]ETV80610.1 hypothetical protein H257_06134 [Aphanomyces astaci]|eukprot:XP_009829557.1 hypothetical protein H257_06134 [Aphanomyces astaci]